NGPRSVTLCSAAHLVSRGGDTPGDGTVGALSHIRVSGTEEMTVGGGGAAAGMVPARPDGLKRMWRVRASLPVVEQVPVEVDDLEQRRIAALAELLRHADAALAAPPPRGGRPGLADGPALIFEDHGEIPLFTSAAPSPPE